METSTLTPINPIKEGLGKREKRNGIGKSESAPFKPSPLMRRKSDVTPMSTSWQLFFPYIHHNHHTPAASQSRDIHPQPIPSRAAASMRLGGERASSDGIRTAKRAPTTSCQTVEGQTVETGNDEQNMKEKWKTRNIDNEPKQLLDNPPHALTTSANVASRLSAVTPAVHANTAHNPQRIQT